MSGLDHRPAKTEGLRVPLVRIQLPRLIKFVMEERIEIFKSLHKSFLDMLMDDTWLMEEPIDVAETEACWRWAIELGDETVPVEKFEEEFKFSLQDLTNWWNKKVLDLSI